MASMSSNLSSEGASRDDAEGTTSRQSEFGNFSTFLRQRKYVARFFLQYGAFNVKINHDQECLGQTNL